MWWLQPPGIYIYRGAAVSNDGSIIYLENSVDYVSYAVRPALWINLGS